MTEKILVTYASRAGSTAEIAEAIGKEIAAKGISVDVRPLKEVKSLTGYQGVVVGSAVRFSAWLPEAVKFVEANLAALSQVPTAFFTVHILNTASDDLSQKNRLAYINPVRALVKPVSEAFFAGVGDFDKVSFIERMIGKMVKSPSGDFRDWNAIRAWAGGLPAVLSN